MVSMTCDDVGGTIDPLKQDLALELWQGSRTHRVYTDIKIVDNTKINHIMVSFTDYYNAISIDTRPSNTKIGKIHGILIIIFYWSL